MSSGVPGDLLSESAVKAHTAELVNNTESSHFCLKTRSAAAACKFLHAGYNPRTNIQGKPSQLPPGLGWVCGWGPSLVTSISCSRAGRGHLIVEPVCWQEALPRPAGSQHDNETVSMEMSL